MSQMLAEIERIINEDVSNRVTQYDVLYEAITNSIHANATKIICTLNSFDNLLNDEEGNEIADRKIDTIKVADNGDGINDDNYNSFCKFRSNYKIKLGCKGVGRFTFLKVYDNAKYKSSLVSLQETRSFVFDSTFDTTNITKNPEKIEENLTEILLERITPQYLNVNKNVDRREVLELNIIREKVLIHLIPTLFFYKKKGVEIEINFVDDKKGDNVSITKNDIPDFLEKKFEIVDKDSVTHTFILNHKLQKANGVLYTFYCANSRTVCEFGDKDFKITLPYGYSGFLLLESEYLDKRVNNERNDFDIMPIRTDVFSTISWEMINSKLKNEISAIVTEDIPETENINREKINEIQEERPYLIEYIEEDDIDMAGFLDKKYIIEKAKKKFDVAKEKFLANSGKSTYSDKELNEAIQITQNELVAYIFDRVQVIDRLKAMIEDKEKVEAVIHNLFMQKYSEDDYFVVGKNNLWLLDDRFTSYSYAASDKRIKDVLAQIGEESGETENINDKPDLSLFFSHNPLQPDRLKSVLIEIKPFDYDAKSDRKKFQGIQQLVDYVEAFKNKEKVEEIWAFLITDVDEKLEQRLRKDDYTPLFSTASPIFHRFYNLLGVSIYVINAKTLILDAEAKNKVFLDIIRKQHRLNELLK